MSLPHRFWHSFLPASLSNHLPNKWISKSQLILVEYLYAGHSAMLFTYVYSMESSLLPTVEVELSRSATKLSSMIIPVLQIATPRLGKVKHWAQGRGC